MGYPEESLKQKLMRYFAHLIFRRLRDKCEGKEKNKDQGSNGTDHLVDQTQQIAQSPRTSNRS